MQQRLSALCASLALVIASGAGLSADAPRNTKPFTRFKVFLQSMLNDTLPFDVPFIVWGDVPDPTADHLSLSIAIVDKTTSCSQQPAGNFRFVDRVEVLKWTQSDYTDRDLSAPSDLASATRKQFEVLVKPLAPNKFYCFLFQVEPGRPLRNAEVMALSSQVMPAYLAYLAGRGRILDVADPDVEPLRQQIAAAVLNAVPLKTFRPRTGSVFDPEATAASVAAQFKAAATPVLQAHNNVFDALDNFQATTQPSLGQRQNAVNAWGVWSNDAAYRSLATDPTLSAPDRALVGEFAGLSEQDRTNMFVGLPKGVTFQALTELQRDPSMPPLPAAANPNTHTCPGDGDLGGRCQLLDLTQGKLRQLAQVVTNRANALPAGAAQTQLQTIAGNITATASQLGTQHGRLINAQTAANDRYTEVERHVLQLQGMIAIEYRALTTTVGNFDTRKTWYLSMDTGIAIAPGLNEIFPYVGTNIYFRPVNKEAPPTVFLSRFSMLFGFTWTSNLNKPGETQALYGDNANIVLGAGVRATDVLRLSGGVLVLKGVNPNPLIDRTRLEVTPFFSISADIDVAGILGGLFGANKTPPTLGAGTAPK